MKADLILLKNLQLRMAEVDESLHPLIIQAMEEYSQAEAKRRYDKAKAMFGIEPDYDKCIRVASGLTKTE